jgi:biopolymer transport protein ExbD
VKVSVGAKKRARIEMLPLIDIVFLLLVFFIYAMLSMAVHRSLPVALPQSAVVEIDNQERISVSITDNGEVYLDRQLVKLSELSKMLEGRTAAEKERGVQVFADRLVEYQRLFMVLDCIQEAGISSIALQAEKDGGA